MQTDLSNLASKLETRIGALSSFQTDKSSEMKNMIASFLQAETKHLDDIYRFIDSQLSLFECQRQNFETSLTDAKSGGDLILGEIKLLREDIKRKISEGLSGLDAAAQTISQGIVDAMVTFQQQVYSHLDVFNIDARFLRSNRPLSEVIIRFYSKTFN